MFSVIFLLALPSRNMIGYTSFDTALNDEKQIESDVEREEFEASPLAPNTMRAVVFSAFGEIEQVVQEKQLAFPTITKEDEVLIKVLYAAMNSVDCKIILGAFGSISPRKPNNVTGTHMTLLTLCLWHHNHHELEDVTY